MTANTIESPTQAPADDDMLNARPAQVILGIDGMVSPRSPRAIEAALNKMPGVRANASFVSKTLRVDFDRNQCALPEIVRRLDDLGFRLRQNEPGKRPKHVEQTGDELTHDPLADPATKAHGLARFWKLALEHYQLSMATIGALLLIVAVITKAADGPPALRYACVAGGFVLAGWFTAIDTFNVLRQFRFDIDVLMFAAAFGAAALGKYEEGCFLLVLFAFGGAGEELAMDRARRAIEALAKLAPDVATLKESDGRERQVKVEDLAIGNRIIIRPFDRVPADGIVETGESAIDQSPITGESAPVEKNLGSNVFAGTINGEGLLIVSVSKTSAESTLAKIVKMVNEAQTTKSPTQLFTDKVEHFYVPIVLLSTTALIFLPPLFGLRAHSNPQHVWQGWFYQAMAFLTAASPCALAIGTPAAVLSGIARAARIGVLVKGGIHLENLGRVRVVAFDKTGTLTRGRPEVTDVISLDPAISEVQLLSFAAAAEKGSTHPLATAIVAEARSRGIALVEATDVQQVSGQGMTAIVGGATVTVGRPEMLDKLPGEHPAELRAAMKKLGDEGKSIVAVAIDGKPAGVFGLADRERPNARETMNRLHQLGIEKTVMLTGDRLSVATPMAARVGVDEFHADLLPKDKLDLVAKLQAKYGPIAMVGDGVNDAPALASATVGIAMGGAGTDVAIETADIALMADDLAKLPDAIGLSRFSRKIIKQNLTIALGVIAVLAPLAALGHTALGVAVLFHEGSTVVVVLNSMRLLVYRPRK